jgi:prevent-host-death family protein
VATEVTTSRDLRIGVPKPLQRPPNGGTLTLDEDGRLIRVAEGRVTREIGVKELKERTSEVIERVASGERVAVTRRNELAAVILSIDEALEFVLAHAADFVRARARTRSEHS